MVRIAAIDDILECSSKIAAVSSFEYVEPNGKDLGINVRKKAETILGLGRHFSVELIHHDSPLSPFYNASQTQFSRASAALKRSNSHADYLSRLVLTSTQSNEIPEQSEYFMTVSIGTPPVETLAGVDTSSNLIWTQCKPPSCFSRTHHQLSCGSMSCSNLSNVYCRKQKECLFNYSQYSVALLAAETLTFIATDTKQLIPVPDIAFGCLPESAFDLVGLGQGPLSLISQLGPSIEWKFSYCLAPQANDKMTSLFRFGSDPASKAWTSTPLVSSLNSLYLVNLEGISLGNKDYQVWGEGKGRVVIDPGTLFTYLPAPFLTNFIGDLADIFENMSNVPAGIKWGAYDMCYKSGEGFSFSAVDITFRFEGGADVSLGRAQTFVQVDDHVLCLALEPSRDSDLAIFGALAQQGFDVEYDLSHMNLSFSQSLLQSAPKIDPFFEFDFELEEICRFHLQMLSIYQL
ncbi:hypothetical protein J5N97_008219 [Dioscorea zingiberensis]|uniref:Peptidase A1 domain-containing protein n=1 Tax=Dioscorea zingiberensis TaxID=325984 RepID=A0A9D5DDF6_9LILI|nr:hypothetical protein J5N97_008219 [Dioscorea zingiberensis]